MPSLPLRSLLLGPLALLAAAAPAEAIVGGQPASRAYPHMAAVEFRGDSGFRFGCGGSLIRQDVVLTAAHCVSGDDDGGPDTLAPADVRVQLGTQRRSQGGERIGVTEVLEHPAFDDSPAGGSDVALLKLATPSATGRTIALGQPADAAPNREAIVIGFGALFPFGPGTDELREATVPLVSDDECEATSTSRLDRPTQLCAGNLEGAEDSCQGDSGGPLMVPGASGALVLVGAVSQGVGCGTPTQYGIYAETAIDPLRSYIETNASRMSTAPATAGGGAGGGTGTAGGGGSTGGGGGSTAGGIRLTLPATLGSAQRARARRRVAFRVRTTGTIVRLTARLVQRGRIVASGRRAVRFRRSGAVGLRVRGAVRSGRAVLRVTARDGNGRIVRASRTVRLGA